MSLVGKILNAAALFIGLSLSMVAQNTTKIVVSGTVVDKDSQPVIGAGVLQEGTSFGTVTNENGHFSLEVPVGSQLQISCIGYTTQTIPAQGTNLKIVLLDESTLLDELVVVGYGTARKGDLTGPISVVSGDDISKSSETMISNALQGQIAGVQVTRANGGPNAQATIRIRGYTNTSNNDPLVIIDGIPGSLNDVVSSDVQNITVLKDAASAAIYGSRAAAGVILITTKMAKPGNFSVEYGYEYAFDYPTARPKNGTVIDYLNAVNEFKWNDGAASQYNQYSEEYINTYMENNAKDPYHYANEDWVALMIKDRTSHQKHTFSVSGGTEKLRTKFSFNYQDNQGWETANTARYQRYSGRLNNTYIVNDWIRATVNVDFSMSDRTAPISGSFTQAYRVPAIYPVKWENGNWTDVKDGCNYYAAMVDGGNNHYNYYKFNGKAQLDITPVKGLTLTAAIAPGYTFTYRKQFKKTVPTYYEDGGVVYEQSHMNSVLTEARNNTSTFTSQLYANYSHKWGNHSLNAMAGYEGFLYKYENLGASRENYILSNFPYLDLGPKDYQYNSGDAGHNAYSSVFGRIMYSFKDRYMIQANVRSDSSSRFAKGYRTGVFPSVSAGWVISDEPWFKVKGLNYLKFRASIGQLGNEQIGGEFPYLGVMNIGTTYLYDSKAQSTIPLFNAAQYTYAYNDITWETTTTYDLGFDSGFWNNRLMLSADVYYKKTEDMLLVLGFPSYSGYSAPEQNAGDMHTYGWEVEAKWQDKVGDFAYSISGNLSDYRSIMGYLGDRKTVSGNYLLEEGSYYNEWYMYKTDGLIQTEADMKDANGNPIPTISGADQPGCIKFVDVNEDGVINADDKVKFGNSLPELLYGLNFTGAYKGFDFGLQLQGIGHRNVLFSSQWIEAPQGQWGNIPELVVGNYWSRANTPEQNLKAKYPLLTYSNRANTQVGSDYWLFNGAYLRVKNVTIGYTVPKLLTSKLRISNLRVYVSAQDLPAISHFPKGHDPEISGFSQWLRTSLVLGANVKF